MNLSVCIIAKNEEQNIEKCLKKLSGYGFELVVVDTGSTDRTKEIAAKYTDKLYDFVWCDDFAKAKNFAILNASNDMVMVIDSDEFMESINISELEKLIKNNPKAVGRICRKNIYFQNGSKMESVERINRIFSKSLYEYQGKIHEQLVSRDSKEYKTYNSPIVIEHAGYLLSEEDRKRKARRNMTMLLKELEENGDDPYILYQLGKSCSFMGEYSEACEYYSRALSYDLNPALEYVIDMVEAYGYAMLNSNQAAYALSFVNIENEFGNTSDFQLLLGLIYMNNEMFDKAVESFQKAVSLKKARTVGTDSYLANYNIGVVYECLGDVEKALKYYRLCGTYSQALNRIDTLLSKKQ